MVKVQEREAFKVNGFGVLLISLLVLAVGIWIFVRGVMAASGPVVPATAVAEIVGGVVLAAVSILLMAGLIAVQPNEARVLIFFGKYTGSVRQDGFWWTNPFTSKRRVSLRVRNFNSERLKVNDADGNPIEIAAVVVWRVVDSARAVFDVDDYQGFVAIQSETAIRSLATRYPYDAPGTDRPSLRENPNDVAEVLRSELQQRLEIAGVEVTEARLTHLAYAPEIAQAMLRRQQAQAVVAARQLIVEAAVGMVEDALASLAKRHVVDLTEERKAQMVNNLMVTLTSEQASTPVINAGTTRVD